MGWLFVDNIMRLGGGFLMSVWIARYLGPAQFGMLNYAIVFVALIGAAAGLGLKDIVVRNIVCEPESTNSILGAAFILQLIGGILAAALVAATITWLRPEDVMVKTMVSILGASLLFKCREVIKYWFESQLQSRYTVLVENCVFIIIVLIKVAMILNHAPLMAFIWIVLVEAMLSSAGLFYIYVNRQKNIFSWSFSMHRAKALLKDSWPLIFMTVMLGVYTKIDILMVEHFLGWEDTGVYSAAVKISESWYFSAVIITNSLYPNLISSHQVDNELFMKRIYFFYNVMFWFPTTISVLLYFLSDYLIILFYGNHFRPAIEVFQLYLWSSVLVFVITASSRWFLIKNRAFSLLLRSIFGAFLNVMLNYLFLHWYGLIGAAWATLVSYFFVAYVYDFFDTNAREQIKFKINAVFYPLKCLYKIL
jgi:PST family polysaccharide transporter